MSNDFHIIKERIRDENRVEEVLEKLECNFICRRGNRVEAQLPERFEKGNKRAVQVYLNDSLSARIRNMRLNQGDIINLVSFILTDGKDENDLFQAKKWLCTKLGYSDVLNQKYEKKEDPVAWFKKIKRKYKKKVQLTSVVPNKVLPEEILDYYHLIPYQGWIDEGIDWETQYEFEVGFDLESARVIFPIRNSNGELIGVKGRTVIDDERKYLYLHECNKNIELFNYHRALPYIKEKRQVIVFEGAKSVMKAWAFGYKNCVAIEGNTMSDIQLQLLYNLGMDVEIVFALDEDITQEEVQEGFVDRVLVRKVSMVIDTFGLLDEKDSPVDKGKEVWDHLLKNRILCQIKL